MDEHFLWKRLKELNNEFSHFAHDIIETDEKDKHDYLREIQSRSGENRADFLNRLIDFLSCEDFWSGYVNELEEWALSRLKALEID